MADERPYLRVRIDFPSKDKSSPENRLFHALVGQLAMYRETTPALMKRYIKVRGSANGYPFDVFQDGERRAVEPKSVAKASTVELAILIDTCYSVASEWQVELKQ